MYPNIAVNEQKLEQWSPYKILAWAVRTFGQEIVMSSSFQQQSLALLHIVSQVAPELPVLFVDSGHHFPETLAFKEQITRQFGLNVIDLHPAMSPKEQEAEYGPELWKHQPDLCCYLNKVEPMQDALRAYRAWITGIRRDQSAHRARAKVVEVRKDGLIKVNPMVMWTQADVWRHIKSHHLPTHPLYARGYKSIGCAPCTQPAGKGSRERAGRWPGRHKTECGLHTVLRVDRSAKPCPALK